MLCPKCGRAVDQDAVICGHCEFILDASFLGDDITDDEKDHRPGKGGMKLGHDFGDALLLGDGSGNLETFDAGETALVHKEVTHARFYVSGASQALLAPDAIPALVEGVEPSGLRLTPFERHLLAFVDGRSPVDRLRRKSGMDDLDVKTTLATLADKGVIRMAGRLFQEAPGDKPRATKVTWDEVSQKRRPPPPPPVRGKKGKARPEPAAEATAVVAPPPPPPPPASVSGRRKKVVDKPGARTAPPPETLTREEDARARQGSHIVRLDELEARRPPPAPPPSNEELATPPPTDVAGFAALPLTAELPAGAMTAALERERSAARGEPVEEPEAAPPPPVHLREPSLVEELPDDAILPMEAPPPTPAPVEGPPGLLALDARGAPPAEEAARPARALPPRRTDGISHEQRYKAAKIFEQALKDLASGNVASARMNAKLAVIYDAGEPRYKEALDEWEKMAVAAAEPAKGKAREVELFESAQVAEGRGEFKEAVRLLEQAVEANGEVGALHNRLGVVLATRLKDFDRATEALQRAIELEPDNPTFKNNLGKVLAWAEAARDKDPKRGKKKGGFFSRGQEEEKVVIKAHKYRPKMF
ncbi:MAG: tetratricopeptide repeat protein [Deltaproteobacteria bacterium]|nr:tetratricopeptide repeat protein [Deltaproteobacteria bacterium]